MMTNIKLCQKIKKNTITKYNVANKMATEMYAQIKDNRILQKLVQQIKGTID